jgi:hypothetical protein
MKKTILFFIAILFGVSLAGESGDGKTPGTAYYGIITTARSWTYAYNGGIIYVGQTGNEDLTIGTGGSLSIEAGVTVKFCTTGSDLIISGTGSLSAIGNSLSLITFTKNTQASWGHISYEGSTGSSVLDHCIIEYGLKSGGGIEGYGGGIHANTSNLTISYCTVQNNYALYGGGIFVNKNQNPSISNCIIKNNIALIGGGGLYFWNTSSSTVTNCIIYKNSVTGAGYGGGGVFIGPASGSIKIVNSVIANNTATNSSGAGIYFYTSSSAAIINSIIWGTPDQLYFLLTSINVMQYCGIKGVSYTTCLNLNSDNNQPDGPNFTDPTNDDYTIKFISPCRDAGISTGAPATDYLGNPRIGNYDIGAYEVQYSRWNGTANDNLWTTQSNWDGNVNPGSGTGDIIIPSGLTHYPIGDPNQGFVLSSGKYMILNPGAQATFGNFRTTGATLKLESDASDISSLIVSSITGTATLDLYLTGGNPGAPTLKLNKWHFISSPVSSLAVSTFAPTYTLNVVGWYDNRVSASLAQGWVAYDGYIYATGSLGGPTFSNLTPGNGYDYYATTDLKYTFSGSLNVSDVPMSLSYAVDDALHGFNLLGNPFSSGLDWDYILSNTPYPAYTSKSLYFTRDNAQCSYISGVGIPVDVTGIIPPMQGFFIKTYSADNTITLPAGARVQGSIHGRYKGETIIPLVRLSLAEGTLTDESVVRFDNAAKSGLDYDYDAPKMFLSSDVLSIYSSSGGTNFAINGLPFPDTLVEIPIVVNLTATGNHTISATQLQGLDNYDVNLTDNTTGFTANLKTTPVLTFSAAAGTIADRFVLKVGKIMTGIENPVASENTFNIYPANSFINIQTISDQWDGKSGSVKVLDLTGKIVSDLNNSEFIKNSLVQVASPVAKGIYFVELKSGVMRYVGKVVIR